jgi:hypothetical protein
MCMYSCMYVYIFVCLYVWADGLAACIHMYMCAYEYECMHSAIWEARHNMYVCVLCVYVFMPVCMYLCTYTHTQM